MNVCTVTDDCNALLLATHATYGSNLYCIVLHVVIRYLFHFIATEI